MAEAKDRLPAVERVLAVLRADAAAARRRSRATSAEARKRIEIAGRAATDGMAALTGGDRGAAARAAKASQDALAQAAALLDAIEREGAALDEARRASTTALATRPTRTWTRRARRWPGPTETDQQDELARARAKLDAAEAATRRQRRETWCSRTGWPARPSRPPRQVVASGPRGRGATRAGSWPRWTPSFARRSCPRIGPRSSSRSRGHGIGRRARTALSEADAALEPGTEACETRSAGGARRRRRAAQLANDAYERARSDFGATDAMTGRGGTVVIGGQPYPTGAANWGNDMGGAIIGGIIGSILSGGGRGWGRWGWRLRRRRRRIRWGRRLCGRRWPRIGGGFGGGGGRSRGGGW